MQTLHPLFLGPLEDVPRFLGRRYFLCFGNLKFQINLKFFADFAYFRLINHLKPAKHRRQLTYQDASFQWLKVLLLGVERWRLNLDCFGCFCEKTFTHIFTFLFVYAWAIFRQTIAPKLSTISEKPTTIEYFFDKVKFLWNVSIGAILLASNEFPD